MRSTPTPETPTLSAVTATPPNDPDGAFYLNPIPPPQLPRRWPGWVIALIAVAAVLTLGLGVALSSTFATTPAAKPTAATSADPDGMGQPAAGIPWTSEARATSPKELTVQLGETFIYTAEWFGADDEVHYTLAIGRAVTRTKFGTKPEKGQFFSLTAAVSVVKGSAYVYGGNFALVTKEGDVYEAAMSHAVDGGLDGVEVRAGQKASGLVVWDIPAGVQVGAKVELRAGGPGGNQGFWQLP